MACISLSGGSKSHATPPRTPPYVQPFPVPAHTTDAFATTISTSVPLIMVLAWIYAVAMTTRAIVYEKESRLKVY